MPPAKLVTFIASLKSSSICVPLFTKTFRSSGAVTSGMMANTLFGSPGVPPSASLLAVQLAALLQAQQYSAGLAFLPPEAPTNNSDAAGSAWSSGEVGAWSALDRDVETPRTSR